MLIGRYSMISEQGKGTPKMVYMRGQTIEEVVVKTEYHTEVSPQNVILSSC